MSDKVRVIVPERQCPTCQQIKPAAEFYLAPTHTFGLSTYCRVCTRTRQKIDIIKRRQSPEWVAKRTDARRWAILKYKYGILPKQYEAMFAAQGGACAICQAPGVQVSTGSNRDTLAVDHCHTTGKIRALLCGTCNRGIGNLGEDPARLRAAADYVEKHK